MRALGSTFGIEIMSTLSLLKLMLDAGHIDYARVRQIAASETLRVAVQGPESDDPGPATNQGITASFHEAPATHDGAAALSFEVHISEAFKLRWRTMLNHAFTVATARVTRARRPRRPLAWTPKWVTACRPCAVEGCRRHTRVRRWQRVKAAPGTSVPAGRWRSRPTSPWRRGRRLAGSQATHGLTLRASVSW